MPWKETCAVDERMRFVLDHERDEWTMAQLCRQYDISRKTGYKWLARATAEGLGQLGDRSRAPHRHPNQIALEIEQAVLAMRAAHPTWGPKKLLRRLEDQDGRTAWPARSTIAELLRRRGLARSPKRRPRTPPYSQPFASCDGPNSVWCIDFKGWFRTGDGRRCDPLTISDGFSRYLLSCRAVEDTGVWGVRPWLEAAFAEYGLPGAIRSDNGPPFASRALGGLSRLSVWWIKLGIVPERIEPGKPQQNGRHERMHLTLQREACRPPASTARAQQRRFDAFRREYNQQRPHEALGLDVPASWYRPSPRPYPAKTPQMSYPDAWPCRRVRSNGEAKFGGLFFVSETLVGELVGFEPLDGRHWRVYFGPVGLGIFDEGLHRMLTASEAKRKGLAVASPAERPASAALQQASPPPGKVLPMCLD